MVLSSDSSCNVLSDEDYDVAARLRQRARRDFAVLLIADDTIDARNLQAETLAYFNEFVHGQGLTVVGMLHLRWDVYSSSEIGLDEGVLQARDVARLRKRDMSEVTHWLEYEVMSIQEFDEPREFGALLPEATDWLNGHRCVGEFRCWGPVARAVLQKQTRWINSVPIHAGATQRLVGTPCHRPKYRDIRNLIECVRSHARPYQSGTRRNVQELEGSLGGDARLDPTASIDYLAATRHLRSLDSAGLCQNEFLTAALVGPAPVDAEVRTPPSRRLLIKNRPRFDVCMMLARRNFLVDLLRQPIPPKFYYMADASSACGYESFSVIENVVLLDSESASDLQSDWRQAPTVFLGIGMLSLKHKVFAFLWAIWLEVGPNQSRMRWKCNQICGLTTDRGIEIGICDSPDVLPDFLQAIGAAGEVPRQEYLFPQAVWIAGWHHLLDNCIEQVLSAVDWWPVFFDRLRQATKFLRIDTHREKLASVAESFDMDARVLRVKPPSFLNLRWDTLAFVCSWYENASVALQCAASGDLFRSSQQAQTAKAVCRTLGDAAWWTHMWIALDWIMAVHDLRRWAGGCPCHEEDRRAGRVVECAMASRRLPEACGRVDEFLLYCSERFAAPHRLDRVEGLSLQLEETRQWGWRYLHTLIQQQTQWLSLSPCNLVHCVDIASLRAARAGFAVADPTTQHRVSKSLFGAGGHLKCLTDASIESGVIHKLVWEQIMSVRLLPLAEHRGEQPHAMMHKEAIRSRRGTRIWHACTQRLKQNVVEYRKFTERERAWVARDWLLARRVLQVSPKREWKETRRVTLRNAYAQVYRGTLGVPVFGKSITLKHEGAPANTPDELTINARITGELLKWVVKNRHFYSVGPDPTCEFYLFQVVWMISPAHKWVSLAGYEPRGHFRASVLRFVPRVPVVDAIPETMDVCAGIEGSVIKDLQRLCSWHVFMRTMRKWTLGPSIEPGCKRLRSPQILMEVTASINVASPDAPLFLILHQLKAKGWRLQCPERPLILLTSAVPNVMSSAMFTKRLKAYFQILNALLALFSRGLTELSHRQQKGYYVALLCAERPAAVPTNRRQEAYAEFLDAERLQALDQDVDMSDGDVGSEHSAGDVLEPEVEEAAETAAVLPPPPLPPPASSSSSSSTGDASSSDSDAAAVPEALARREVVVLGPHIVTFEEHTDVLSPGKSYRRYRVSCIFHDSRCRKSRCVGPKFEATHGVLEPVAFCIAWALAGHRFIEKKAHGKHSPSASQVAAAVEQLRESGIE